MLQLHISNQPVDLPANAAQALRLTLGNQRLEDIARLRGDASYTLTLPATARNQQVLGPLHLLALDMAAPLPQQPDVRHLLPAVLVAGGTAVLVGWARLLGWNETRFEVQLLGGNAAWGIDFRSRLLGDVDTHLPPAHWRNTRWWRTFDVCDYATTSHHTGYANPLLAGGTPEEIREGFQAAAYPLVAYNTDMLANLPSQELLLKDLRPATFVGPLLLAHFAAQGFQLESQWLDEMAEAAFADSAPPLVLPFVQEAWPIAADFDETLLRTRARSTAAGATSNRLKVLATNLSIVDIDSLGEWGILPMADPLFAPNGYGTVSATAWKPSQPGVYRISGQAVGVSTTPNPVFFAHVLDAVGTLVDSPYSGTIQAISNNVLDFSFDLHFRAEWVAQGLWLAFGQLGALNNSSLGPESFVEIRRLNQVVEGVEYDLRATLPSLTVMDLLNALTAMYHLHFQTDTAARTVRMEPRDLFLRPGGQDLDAVLNTAQPLPQRLAAHDVAATVEWAYGTAPDDSALKTQDAAAALPTGAAQWSNALAPSFDTRQQVRAVPFAPAVMAWNDTAGVLFPDFRNADYPTFRTRHAPRILAFRLARAAQPFTLRYTAPVASCGGTPFTTGTWESDAYPQAWFDTLSNSLGFADATTCPGLASRHYGTWWHNLARARRLEIPLRTSPQPLGPLADFSRLHRLGQQRVQALQLRGYAPGTSGTATLEAITQDTRTWVPERRFRFTNALCFTGANGWAHTPDSPAHWCQPTGVALSLWVRIDALPTTEAYIAGHETVAGNNGWCLLVRADGTLKLRVANGSLTSEATGATALPLGQWVHLVAHFGNFTASFFNLYLNAAADTLTVVQNDDCSAVSPPGAFAIGQWPGNPTAPERLQARVTEVVLVRTVSPAWVAHVYGAGLGNFPPNPDGVLGYWPLAETQGTTAPPLWGPRPLALTHFPAAQTAEGGGAWVAV